MEVNENYLQNGELGAVSVIESVYEAARDKAFELVSEGAEKLSIMVDREQILHHNFRKMVGKCGRMHRRKP